MPVRVFRNAQRHDLETGCPCVHRRYAEDTQGPIAVLGPGTGLGEAMLFYNQQAGRGVGFKV